MGATIIQGNDGVVSISRVPVPTIPYFLKPATRLCAYAPYSALST